MYNVWYWVFSVVFLIALVCYAALSIEHLRLVRQQLMNSQDQSQSKKNKSKVKIKN